MTWLSSLFWALDVVLARFKAATTSRRRWWQACRRVICFGLRGWPEMSPPAVGKHQREKDMLNHLGKKKYFTSSDPHRDIILKHIRHKFWHSFCPLVSRFHQNYPLLLVPSPGSGSSSDHGDLSSQTDSNWLSLCLIQNNFRRPGVSRRLGVWRRLGAWKLRFERYKTIWLS